MLHLELSSSLPSSPSSLSQVAYPSRIWLLRGNHEFKWINEEQVGGGGGGGDRWIDLVVFRIWSIFRDVCLSSVVLSFLGIVR
jgi:hypothetical protein